VPQRFDSPLRLARPGSASPSTASRRLQRAATCLVSALGLAAGLAGCVPRPDPAARFERVVVSAELAGDCKAIGDIDGDGKPDVIVGGSELAWYRGPDWHKFAIANARVEFTTDCQVRDLNGDGRLDIIGADGKEADNVVWFENTGTGRWTRHTIGTHGNWVHDLEVEDFDGDGRLDVLTHGHGTHIWYQDGPQRWADHGLGTPDTTKEGVGIGDIDRDGRIDIVQGGWWFRNPGGRALPWRASQFAAGYDGGSFTSVVADLDRDGRPDIVVAEQHQRHELAWFASPLDPGTANWPRHVLDGDMGAHKLNVADVDGDGYPDVIAGLELKELRAYLSDGGSPPQFARKVLNTTGCHNTRIGDVDADGRVDILCANYIGHPPVELWFNRTTAPATPGAWQHILVDSSRAKLATGYPAFGLAFGDLDRDGRVDIVSGKYFYRNPGGRLTGRWTRTTFPVDADAILVVDVDGDGQLDVIAQSLPKLYWLKPNADATRWTARVVAELPATAHTNGQGFRLAHIVPSDARPAIVITAGDGIWVTRIPADPASAPWPSARIAADTSEDLLAAGDIDRDGLVDVVASDGHDGKTVSWYRNPGNIDRAWERRTVGLVTDWGDRAEVADIDGDGRIDVLVSTENGKPDDATTYWFQAPADPTRPWTRHTLATQGSTNSLSVADVDGNGQIAVVTGEHKGALRVRIWTSRDHGISWSDRVVDRGKESHLGTRLVDLDGDGALDIVSIAWDTFSDLRIWRNDTRMQPAAAPPAGR
jgi:hypothetical protein